MKALSSLLQWSIGHTEQIRRAAPLTRWKKKEKQNRAPTETRYEKETEVDKVQRGCLFTRQRAEESFRLIRQG